MQRDIRVTGGSRLTGVFATGFLLSAAVLAWLGVRAVSEWQRSATRSAEYRAQAAVDLLTSALSRDMRALQVLVLPSILLSEPDDGAQATVRAIATAFAKYPYAEAFFTWDGPSTPVQVTFFTRADRAPAWVSVDRATYPLVISRNGAIADRLLHRVGQDVARRRQLSTFDMALADTRYQVVAAIRYEDALHTRAAAVRGFMVDMNWSRRAYFPQVAAQIVTMNGAEGELGFLLADNEGSILGDANRSPDAPSAQRTIAALFFDPIAVAIAPPPDLRRDVLTIRAVADRDPLLLAAGVGTQRAWVFGICSAMAVAVGFVLTLRAVRTEEQLAGVRAEFVSSVTHELKAPIATISAIAETFLSGRSTTPELTQDYGRIAFHEARRLTRLIDNLLAYARIADVTEVYAFEMLEPREIIDDTLREFGSQLDYEGFQVDVQLADDLPRVSADRRAMRLVLGNLLENAIRYSPANRHVRVSAQRGGNAVEFTVQDRGIGIAPGALPYVTQRFNRGDSRERSGTGLGLAIVDRIVRSHGGRLVIESTQGAGTTVRVTVPVSTV